MITLDGLQEIIAFPTPPAAARYRSSACSPSVTFPTHVIGHWPMTPGRMASTGNWWTGLPMNRSGSKVEVLAMYPVGVRSLSVVSQRAKL